MSLFLAATLMLTASGALIQKEIFYYEADNVPSEYWPSHVLTTKQIEVNCALEAGSSVILKKGLRAVLVRVEVDKGLLLDFGRDGIHYVSPESTDFLESVNRFASGKEKKLQGNMAGLIAQRLIQPLENTVPIPLRFDRVLWAEYFLIVYTDKPAEELAYMGALGKQYQQKLEDRKVLVMMIPQYRFRDSELAQLLFEHNIEVPFMRSFLAEPYSKVFAHDLRSGIVLVDKDGDVLFRYAGEQEAVLKGYAQCLERLDIVKADQITSLSEASVETQASE